MPAGHTSGNLKLFKLSELSQLMELSNNSKLFKFSKISDNIKTPKPQRTNQMKIYSVLSAKGGTGKSHITAQLADYYAVEKGLKVLVIDIDKQLTCYSTKQEKSCTWKFDVINTIPTSKPDADIIIVDTPPVLFDDLTEDAKKLIKKSDRIIILSLPNDKSLRSVNAILRVTPKDITRPFFTNVKADKEPVKVILDSVNWPYLPYRTHHETSYDFSISIFSEEMRRTPYIKRAKAEFIRIVKYIED